MPTHPPLIAIAVESLVLRCEGFSPSLSLLMPTFAFLTGPARLTPNLHPNQNALLPQPASKDCCPRLQWVASCPFIIDARLARPVSCYALFKGIAASKLTSWLSRQPDLLCSTEQPLGDFSRWSGLFPSRSRTLAPDPSLPHQFPGIRSSSEVGRM